ncbi:hypothetical protein A2210_02345 [Candidatus Woesebacteria bacterium RIFOXYA1_FULL_40_18]|uniref:mevalonate kinase n=1 Tax=Candidatus Woesebacteria bacterium RIFOXYA1_FULL_40_18 TaxID=1802532 RepID=A0A1F8CI32_9BACT|nr:MAG: hypothetical protein A2210_02345 [Candidatus Woesebacteria bacterium RIFOXYA1_FULL_40_18]
MNKKAKNLKVSAPGKIILSGEYAVVYGHPALLTAVSRRLSITSEGGKKRLIDSNIPIGCGMGSSAAYAVAISALKLKLGGGQWDLEKINKEAYKIEKRRHGNPSGGDNTISTYGGFLWYRKEAESLKIFSKISPSKNFPKIFFIDTGKPDESTKEMVSMVGKYYKNHRKKIERIFVNIEGITRAFLKLLTGEENASSVELLKENEKLLEKLDVVSLFTQFIIRKIEKMGGAAKILGAGGKKLGSGIILCYHSNPDKLLKFAEKENLDMFNLKLGEKGVRVDGTS